MTKSDWSAAVATLMLFVIAASGCYTGGPTGTAASSPAGDLPPSGPAGTATGFGGGAAGVATAGGVAPAFGPTVVASVAPPPISGGTLLVLADGVTAIVSDPDRDAVYVVDTATATVTATVALQAGDEPGRLVEDGAGRVHVALRGGSALVTIDPTTGTILERRSVCPAPRGVAWDPTRDAVWVACATGELLALPAAGGAALSSVTVERDLRDVLVQSDGSLAITTFRSAEVLRVATDGSVTRRDSLLSPEPDFAPHVAWRSIHGADQSIVAVYQIEAEQSIPTGVPSAYGSLSAGAGGIVGSVLSILGPDGGTTATFLINGILPVDVALSPDGNTVAVAAPGSAFLTAQGQSPITLFGLDGTNTMQTFPGGLPSSATATFDPDSGATTVVQNGPVLAFGGSDAATDGGSPILVASNTPGITSNQAIAVAFDLQGDLLVQTREPAQLFIVSNQGGVVGAGTVGAILSQAPFSGLTTAIALSDTSRDDSGHDIFHTGAGALIACASCHPEGGDDGFVWTLNGDLRRTPSMRGTIEGTAPYHWPGDEADFTVLTNDVYTNRMAGAPLDSAQLSALQGWVQGIPAPPAPSWVDAAAAGRGQVLFERSDTGCSTCHSGAKFTNNQTLDVGTGGAFQVPPLVGVSWRFPFLHDGCAQTLAERFALDGGCDNPAHGTTSQLSAQDLSDLIAYLESI